MENMTKYERFILWLTYVYVIVDAIAEIIQFVKIQTM